VHRLSVRRRQEGRKRNEGVAFHDGASLHGDGNREDRTDVDEGVEFAVLAASIDAAPQVAKKRGV